MHSFFFVCYARLALTCGESVMDGSSGGVAFAIWFLSFLLVSLFVFLEVTITGISKRE